MHRILVVDDHEYMRAIVCGLIERDALVICGQAADGRQAVEQARILKPDLIILDLHMPVLNGFDATREILVFSPQMPILILSIEKTDLLSRACEQHGARGYLEKSNASDNLLTAAKALLRQETYFSH